MRLITLNTWQGKIFEPLIEFVQRHSEDTDIFCFQEVLDTATDKKTEGDFRVNLLEELQNILPDFNYFHAPAQDGLVDRKRLPYPVSYGIVTFMRKSIQVTKHEQVFVYREKNAMIDEDLPTIPRCILAAELLNNGKAYTICNFHGYWEQGPKTDTPERINQSNNIVNYLNKTNNAKILCGDFNLLPDTESLRILENGLPSLSKTSAFGSTKSARQGMRNLVKENTISTTRSKFYTWDDKFADYILVSPEIQVNKFEVLQDQVSDHLPLLLEFV